MLSVAIAELYIVCPAQGTSPAEEDKMVADPYVILRNGMQMESICIVDLTLIL
jgi:hypothetical protein